MKKESFTPSSPVLAPPASEAPTYYTAPADIRNERSYHESTQSSPIPKAMSNWNAFKLALRVMDIVFTVTNLMLMGILVSLGDYNAGFLVLLVSYPPAAVGIAWNIAEFITLLVRQGAGGIHSGAHVAFHLVNFCAWTAATAISVTTGDLYVSWSGDYYTMNALPWVIVAFFSLTMGCNFTLFVFACRETDVNNKEKRRRRAALNRKSVDLEE